MKPNGSTGHGNGYVAEQDLDEVIVLYVKPPGAFVSFRCDYITSHCSRIRSGPWIVKVQLERRSSGVRGAGTTEMSEMTGRGRVRGRGPRTRARSRRR
jgi:hypothetical protein